METKTVPAWTFSLLAFVSFLAPWLVAYLTHSPGVTLTVWMLATMLGRVAE